MTRQFNTLLISDDILALLGGDLSGLSNILQQASADANSIGTYIGAMMAIDYHFERATEAFLARLLLESFIYQHKGSWDAFSLEYLNRTGGTFEEICAAVADQNNAQVSLFFRNDWKVENVWNYFDIAVGGITDWLPIRRTMRNPLSDVDNDGINNVDEVAAGTDPNVSNIPIQDIKVQITIDPASIITNTTVSITGSVYDNYNNEIESHCRWELYKPGLSNAILENTDSLLTSFIPDEPGSYTIKLTVTDNNNNTALTSKILKVSKVYSDDELVVLEENKIYIDRISVEKCELDDVKYITVPNGEIWGKIKFVYSSPRDLILLAAKDKYPTITSGYEDYCDSCKKPKFNAGFEHDYYDDGGFGIWNETFYPGDKIYISLFSMEGFSSNYGINGDVEIINDRDGDRVPDDMDDFPDDGTKQYDSDGDGVDDNSDNFPNDHTASGDGDLPSSLTKTQVSQLYVSIFGRASEGDGNAYWCQNQNDMVITANVMLDTEPAKAYFGTTLNDNQRLIEFIYENTLGKTYSQDPTGVDYWVSELANGKSKGEVIAALINAALDPIYNNMSAQKQFINKVAVSNYTAETIATVPDVNDLSAFVDFISGVTDDSADVVDMMSIIRSYNSLLNTYYYDHDGDGIPDSQDQCLNTPAGETVDENGCSGSQTGILTAGLVAYYPFNGNADDASENYIDGKVQNAVLTADRFGNPNSAYHFDGDGDYVEVGTTSDFNFVHDGSDFTISVWVKHNSDDTWQSGILGNTIGGDRKGFFLGLRGTGVYFVVGRTSPYPVVGYTWEDVMPEGFNWAHLAITYNNNSNQYNLFINGKNVNEPIEPINSHLDGNAYYTLKIGTYKITYSYGWATADIDDLRFYSITLTEEEIETLFNINGNSDSGSAEITVQSPNGGENIVHESDYSIRWSAPDLDDTVDIQLYRIGASIQVESIASDTPNDGSFIWHLDSDGFIGDDFLIRISSSSDWGSIYDYSDAAFSIDANQVQNISVLDSSWRVTGRYSDCGAAGTAEGIIDFKNTTGNQIDVNQYIYSGEDWHHDCTVSDSGTITENISNLNLTDPLSISETKTMCEAFIPGLEPTVGEFTANYFTCSFYDSRDGSTEIVTFSRQN